MATQAPTADRGGFLGPNAHWRATVWGDYLAEFLGTFVLIAFGCGVVAMYVVGLPGSGRGDGITTDGDWLLITLGWGDGGHLRHLRRRWHQRRAHQPGRDARASPPSAASRGEGARATSSPRSWARSPAPRSSTRIYRDAIQAYETGERHHPRRRRGTVGIFVTGPAGYFGDYWGPFLSEVVGTAFLLLFVFAVVNLMNLPPKANLAPLIIGLAVFAIGISFGANSGLRDQPGPRPRAAPLRLAHGLGRRRLPRRTGGNLDQRTGGCPSSRRSSERSSERIFY